MTENFENKEIDNQVLSQSLAQNTEEDKHDFVDSLSATELQIQKTLEKLERLKEKAAKEKKLAQEKHEKEILAIIKKAGLLKKSKEDWQNKIDDVKMIFEM